MSPEQVRKAYSDEVQPAIFQARGGMLRPASPCVLVYPYKNHSGYLWAFLDGSILDDGLEAIKDGGKTRDLRDAVDNAIERLMVRIDR